MKKLVMQFIQKTPLNYFFKKWVVKRTQAAEFAEWEKKGRPNPPPHTIKQKVLREHAQKYGLKVMVETGTYLGDMVEAMRPDFDQIYSIELSHDLYEKAKMRFKGVKKVELIQGDSGVELGKLMSRINQATLFWLDGHYSAGITAKGEKDTPIFEELRHILGAVNRGHVIIIDDARSFGKVPAYPSIEELFDFVKSKRDSVDIIVRDDSIQITPKL